KRAAHLTPEMEHFSGFMARDDAQLPSPPRFARTTASLSPNECTERLVPVLSAIRAAGLVSAGILDSSTSSIAVATTRGCARAHDSTAASFKGWALETSGAGGAAGYAGDYHRDIGKLDLIAQTEQAIRICKDSIGPTSLEEGTYDVVMEPAAVA